MLQVKGIIPAVLTPFTHVMELDEPVLRRMINRLIDSGVHGLFCLGTNGEFFSLTNHEKLQIARIVVEETRGRVPVYVGTGGISTREVSELSVQMEEIGADALSVITPYFLPFTQQELINHYKSVAASTSLPILLYNIPARTGVSLLPDTVAELALLDNVVGIKDSSGSFELILNYLELTGPEFAVLCGSDNLIYPTLMAGGKGGVSGTANVVPELVISVYNHWESGNLKEAEMAQMLMKPMLDAYQFSTLPSVYKEALHMMGMAVGPSRMPVGPLSEDQKDRLFAILTDYAIQKFIDKDTLKRVKAISGS